MQEIAAFLLGRAQILLDGVRVSLPFKQAEALLYYLLVEGRTSRFKLADLIWGDRGMSARRVPICETLSMCCVRRSAQTSCWRRRKTLSRSTLNIPSRWI